MPSTLVAKDELVAIGGDATRARSFVWNRALLLLVLAQMIALYMPTLRWLWDRWTMSVWHNAHGMFTAGLAAFFIWRQLSQTSTLPVSSSAWGFAFLFPALLLRALDAAMHTELLAAVSLVLVLPGLSLLFLGVVRTRRIAFPLALSSLMLPIPLGLSESIHLSLREVTTIGTATLIPYLGVPVLAEGTTLHLPNATLLVGDACSGFSTLYASVVVAGLAAYHTPIASRRVLVLLAAPPIAIAANIVRVTLLSLLVNSHGGDVLNSWIHPGSGILSFLLALPILFWIARPPRSMETS